MFAYGHVKQIAWMYALGAGAGGAGVLAFVGDQKMTLVWTAACTVFWMPALMWSLIGVGILKAAVCQAGYVHSEGPRAIRHFVDQLTSAAVVVATLCMGVAGLGFFAIVTDTGIERMASAVPVGGAGLYGIGLAWLRKHWMMSTVSGAADSIGAERVS